MSNDRRADIESQLAEDEVAAKAAHLAFRDDWRTGRKVGRTLYAYVRGFEPDDRDILIGLMDSSDLAAHVARHSPGATLDHVADIRWLLSELAEAEQRIEAMENDRLESA